MKNSHINKKICSLCKEPRLLTEFAKCSGHYDGLQTACIPCSNQACKDYYIQNRDREIQRKLHLRNLARFECQVYVLKHLQANPCIQCKESDPTCLQFDHINPLIKTYEISKLLQQGRFDLLVSEIKKCQVLCSNCHNKRTAKQQNWYTLKSFKDIEQQYNETYSALKKLCPKVRRNHGGLHRDS